MQRRELIKGIGLLFAAPAIVRASSLMQVWPDRQVFRFTKVYYETPDASIYQFSPEYLRLLFDFVKNQKPFPLKLT